jgi:hypothetical protein
MPTNLLGGFILPWGAYLHKRRNSKHDYMGTHCKHHCDSLVAAEQPPSISALDPLSLSLALSYPRPLRRPTCQSPEVIKKWAGKFFLHLLFMLTRPLDPPTPILVRPPLVRNRSNGDQGTRNHGGDQNTRTALGPRGS